MNKIIAWYRWAMQTGQLPFAIILTLTIYQPFEDFVLNWLPLPSPLIALIRFVPEIILYILMVRVIYLRLSSGKGIRKTPLDILIIAFFIGSMISIVVNHAGIAGSIKNLRTNFRYISVYYTVVNIDISIQQLSLLLKSIRLASLIQAGIASIQYFLPASISQKLFTRQVIHSGTMAAKNASIGTFGDSAILSGFLMLAISVFISHVYTNSSHLIPTFKDSASILVLYFANFASKKRAGLMISLLIPILVLVHLNRKRDTALILWFSTAILITVVLISPLLNLQTSAASVSEDGEIPDLTSYFFSIFSPDYWQHNLEAQRGWAAKTIVNGLMNSGGWFGFGPEPGALQRGIENSVILSPDEQRHLSWHVELLEDAYWFAFLGYFGIVGLGIFWLILLRLYQTSQSLIKSSSSLEYKSLGVMLCTIIIVSFFYTFVERTFKLRPFSFYFWLLAGLVVNSWSAQQENRE
ncbi:MULTISPECIES: hypothetical protein [unclassified Moorena]|uniref:hypothetical protein n=1 Tax=unclassified Moorena TaxID=2683338 RepID=UPI001401B45E|nr:MULTISPECIES: hypothetical protein [unclassified Moorena]NEO14452.1 hypothetical protein [Moorena sp. SIO3E8]NEP98455.1 hypothetical protein [Moorena sp. SIO3F7]